MEKKLETRGRKKLEPSLKTPVLKTFKNGVVKVETRGRKKLGNRPVKSKGSKNKVKPSVEVIGNVIKEHFGIITESASALNICTGTLYKWINSSPTLTEIFKESRTLMVDTAESALMKNIKSGKETSIIFALKCLGKDRNWIDREEQKPLNISAGHVQINYIIPGQQPPTDSYTFNIKNNLEDENNYDQTETEE